MAHSTVKSTRTLDAQPAGAAVQAGPTGVSFIVAVNVGAAVRYLKLYDKATGPLAADTPKTTIPLPVNVPVNLQFNPPFYFANGLGWRVTTLAPDADTTAPTAGDVLLTMGYA